MTNEPRNDLQKLIDDHDEGFLTAEILLHTPFAPDKTRLEAEILKLSQMIDAEPDGDRLIDLRAAFRALNWARNPDGFAAPSECVLP